MAVDDLEMNRRHEEGAITMRNNKKTVCDELKMLLYLFRSATLTTILQGVFTVSFMVILGLVAQSNGDGGGDAFTNMSAMRKVSEPFLVLAVLTSLGTWFLTGVWESKLSTTCNVSERELGEVSEDPQFSASAQNKWQKCVRDFYFRYMLLVSLRATCIFLFLLGCIFAGVALLRPPWVLLCIVLLVSLIFAVAVIVYLYLDFVDYCNCLTRLAPSPKALDEAPKCAPDP